MAEVMRRLDEVVIRLDNLARTLEEGYVRKDVAAERSRVVDVQMQGFEDEVRTVSKRLDRIIDEQVTNRRLVIGSLIFPIFVGIVIALILTAGGLK